MPTYILSPHCHAHHIAPLSDLFIVQAVDGFVVPYRAGAGGGLAGWWVFGSVLMIRKTKPLPSFRSTQISIALALPFVHKITGCPALIWMLNEGFKVVGSKAWDAATIHKSCPMAVV